MKTPQVLQGIVSLLADPAGALSLIALFSVSFLCFEHRVGDVAFSAVAGILIGMVGLMKHKSFTGSDIDRLHDNSPPAE